MQEAIAPISYPPVPSIVEDLTGRVFGKLTVLGLSRIPKSSPRWVCLCSCGKTREVQAVNLLRKNNQSCGCLRERNGHTKNRTNSLTYRSWLSMWDRCSNPRNPSYPSYGGRGIQICENWFLFSGFLKDMGERPDITYSLDRIDVNGGYSPENCRWATAKQQSRNRRNSRFIEAFGQRKTLAEWSEVFGVRETTIAHRINYGWPTEKAVSAPSKR